MKAFIIALITTSSLMAENCSQAEYKLNQQNDYVFKKKDLPCIMQDLKIIEENSKNKNLIGVNTDSDTYTITYKYKTTFTEGDVSTVKDTITQKQRTAICTGKMTKQFVQAGLVMKYQFYDQQNKLLFDAQTQKSDCSNIN